MIMLWMILSAIGFLVGMIAFCAFQYWLNKDSERWKNWSDDL